MTLPYQGLNEESLLICLVIFNNL